MTSCGVIQMKEDSELFLLPFDHREALDEDKDSDSMIRISRYIMALGCSFPQLHEAFKETGPPGGGFYLEINVRVMRKNLQRSTNHVIFGAISILNFSYHSNGSALYPYSGSIKAMTQCGKLVSTLSERQCCFLPISQ